MVSHSQLILDFVGIKSVEYSWLGIVMLDGRRGVDTMYQFLGILFCLTSGS